MPKLDAPDPGSSSASRFEDAEMAAVELMIHDLGPMQEATISRDESGAHGAVVLPEFIHQHGHTCHVICRDVPGVVGHVADGVTVGQFRVRRQRLSASSLIIVAQALNVTTRELLEIEAHGGEPNEMAAITLEGTEGLLRAYKYMSSGRRRLLREFAQGLAHVAILDPK